MSAFKELTLTLESILFYFILFSMKKGTIFCLSEHKSLKRMMLMEAKWNSFYYDLSFSYFIWCFCFALLFAPLWAFACLFLYTFFSGCVCQACVWFNLSKRIFFSFFLLLLSFRSFLSFIYSLKHMLNLHHFLPSVECIKGL